jgi:hypothetical protein
MPPVDGEIETARAESEERARAAHLRAKAVLQEVRSRWGAESETSTLPRLIEAAAPDDLVARLSCLYVFASRVGGATADDPDVAARWLAGWSGARARVPDDGRAALDAGIAFATRLHDAMGIAGPAPEP